MYLFGGIIQRRWQQLDTIASNGGTTDEWWVERIWKVVYCGTIPEFAWRDWVKPRKNFRQDARCPDEFWVEHYRYASLSVIYCKSFTDLGIVTVGKTDALAKLVMSYVICRKADACVHSGLAICTRTNNKKWVCPRRRHKQTEVLKATAAVFNTRHSCSTLPIVGERSMIYTTFRKRPTPVIKLTDTSIVLLSRTENCREPG
jgi:hypothetical protein